MPCNTNYTRGRDWEDCEILFVGFVFGFFGVFLVLGFELRVYTLSHYTSPIFVMGFLKIGSHKLFAWAGFKP
jgi:hypothetical protein